MPLTSRKLIFGPVDCEAAIPWRPLLGINNQRIEYCARRYAPGLTEEAVHESMVLLRRIILDVHNCRHVLDICGRVMFLAELRVLASCTVADRSEDLNRLCQYRRHGAWSMWDATAVETRASIGAGISCSCGLSDEDDVN